MPYIHVNDTELYYESYGEEQPGKLPVVLIHGSTVTGKADWGLVAPLLARRWHVIVPDCRGHGQSPNPRRTYSFREMSADMAGLVRALGFTRAHIIGHSNGGNVALVTLIEHPEVVQTAVLQAANAYVSPDLVEKEPAIFDPERVAREAPAWMNEMIALHGLTHGPEYWRDLLRLTVDELIREPNYTPADLAQVDRPVLMIQGEYDRVNAPSKHAQFIARYIPQAELWIASSIGHNVHLDALFAWVERVTDFLARRGDDANEALYRLKRLRYRDERETVFEVRAEDLSPGPFPGREGESLGLGLRLEGEEGESGGPVSGPFPGREGESSKPGIWLKGQVLTADQVQAAQEAVGGHPRVDASQVRVLLSDSSPWGLVLRGVTNMHHGPGNREELVNQALFGEAVRILEEHGDWTHVRLEKDGYLGWVHTPAMQRCTRQEVERYRSACNHLVKSDLAAAYHHPVVSNWQAGGLWEEAGKLPFGVAVPVIERQDGAAGILRPDGQVWWVEELSLLPLEERPRPGREGVAQALALVRRFVGVPYLWGGRTPFGYDCSGLAQTFLGFLGIRAPRDADQLYRAGAPLENDSPLLPGDLLFFGEKDETVELPGLLQDISYGGGRRITHVAIALGGEEFIHANGAAWGVSYNSLDPASALYRAQLKERYAGARRFWDAT